MDAKETSLKPCPFCGSEPVMRRGGRYGFWALCQNCGAALRMSDTETDAANAWNRRAAEAELDQASAEGQSSGANPDAETIADIVRGLRNDEAAFDAAVRGMNGWDAVADPVSEIRRMRGDEPDAPAGDAAAMREALEGMAKASQEVFRRFARDVFAGDRRLNSLEIAYDKAEAALSAPARNCDRFANTAQALGSYPFGPPIGDDWGDGDWIVFVDWLFAPAEGGRE